MLAANTSLALLQPMQVTRLPPDAAGGRLVDCSYSQAGDRMATCSSSGTVRVWACGSGAGAGDEPLLLHSTKVRGAAVSRAMRGMRSLTATAAAALASSWCASVLRSARHLSLVDPAPAAAHQIYEEPVKPAWAPDEHGTILAVATARGSVHILTASAAGAWRESGRLACGRGLVRCGPAAFVGLNGCLPPVVPRVCC
jgi:hypothetical protein